MSKRTFRSTPSPTRPSYPTFRGFLGVGGAALALGLLLSGCGTEPLMGEPVNPRALIDARTDGGAEAGKRADAGAHSDTVPIAPTRR